MPSCSVTSSVTSWVVEFESFRQACQGARLEVPAGASQLRVPRNSSPMYLIMGLLVIHQYIPAIAIPEVAKLYSTRT